MSRATAFFVVFVAGCAASAPPTAPAPLVVAQQEADVLTAAHKAAVARILATAQSNQAFEILRELTDGVGHRISGSMRLERAIDWAVARLEKDGHKVERQAVMVPHWVRGEARGKILLPSEHTLHLLALGGSAATARGGTRAELVVVRSFEELEALGRTKVEGKIVLWDVAMTSGPDGPRYGETVRFRGLGPTKAAHLGAVASLVRSVTETSLRSPHTGATSFSESAPIPAAAVSVEDSQLLARLAERGPVTLELELTSASLPDVASANVIAELPGRERPEEVVVIGAHIDSWDVGQGAHDDGAGCAMVMEALSILRREGLVPRRTVRVVLFTNEENGLRGAKAYEAERASKHKHVAAIEADTGSFQPIGFEVEEGQEAFLPWLSAVAAPLAPIGASKISAGHSGADVGRLRSTGALLLGLAMDPTTYFDYHHTEADTLDKVDPVHLRANAAAMAAMAYLLAELDPPEAAVKTAQRSKP